MISFCNSSNSQPDLELDVRLSYFANRKTSDAFRLAAKLEHEGSGRVLEVFTDQPGVQFYTDNFMPTDGSFVGKGGAVYQVIKLMFGSYQDSRFELENSGRLVYKFCPHEHQGIFQHPDSFLSATADSAWRPRPTPTPSTTTTFPASSSLPGRCTPTCASTSSLTRSEALPSARAGMLLK